MGVRPVRTLAYIARIDSTMNCTSAEIIRNQE